MSRNTKTVLALLAAVLVLAVVPFFLAPGAEFGGSDDAGSRMVEEIQGEAYEPWFTPVLETLLGGELPGEIESLLFCIQTGVGVGVLTVVMRMYSRSPEGLSYAILLMNIVTPLIDRGIRQKPFGAITTKGGKAS